MEESGTEPASESLGPKDVLIAQLNDLLRMKANIIASLRKEIDQLRQTGLDGESVASLRQDLQGVQAQHEELSAVLRVKENMLKLARQENELLKAQLAKEKETFTAELLQREHQHRVQLNENKYVRDQCDGLRRLCEEQRNVIFAKDAEIEALRKQLRKAKDSYTRDKQGMLVKHQQELFIAKKLVK